MVEEGQDHPPPHPQGLPARRHQRSQTARKEN